MFSFLTRNDKQEFQPTKKMLEAAIIKGERIGLTRDEIIEMASMMDRSQNQASIEKLVVKILGDKLMV